MKAGVFISYIILSTLIFLLFLSTVGATEYREVKAEEILKHMENGEDVNYNGYRIVGELNASEIKLNTVRNPYFLILLSKYTKDKLNGGGLNERSLVIESNITIENSTFENRLNFSNVQFKNTLYFKKANFNDNVDFIGSNFVNSAYFNGTEFKKIANFSYADFNNSVYFNNVKFTGRTDFYGAKFNSFAYFNDETKFRSNTEFSFANFTGLVDFSNTWFGRDVNFHEAKLAYFTNFTGAEFNDSGKFTGPSMPIGFIVDGANYHVFSRYYNNLNQFELADELYYNYRIYNMTRKSWSDIGFWSDLILFSIYGFGVKPLHSIYFGILSILIFSLIYINPINWKSLSSNIHLGKTNNKGRTLSLRDPGIKKDSGQNKKAQNQEAGIFDVICYSICCFISQSHEGLSPKENFRIITILEGVLGWITLGVFISTLASFITRKP